MAARGNSELTRRDFIRGTGLGTLGWGLGVAAGCTRGSSGAPAEPAAPLPQPPPRAQAQAIRVVIARDPEAISLDGQAVDAARVKELLTKALRELTGEDSLEAALGEFVGPTDRVGVKQNVMMTPVHHEVLLALWEGLESVGVPPENVITWDRQRGHRGYRNGQATDVRFDRDQVATVCSEFADVLINVPGLKSHGLSGIAVCLKNWCGAVGGLNIRDENTPWPIHGDSCADIGMLQAHPSIKGKAGLCVVDALRPLCHGGPQVNPQYLWNYGGLVVGADAVAVDRVCLDIIQERRDEVRGGTWAVSPPPKHIAVAAEKYGLGEADRNNIDVVEV